MPRPKLRRKLGRVPGVTLFKPQGVPVSGIKWMNVTLDEFEAFKLADCEGFDQVKGAEQMGISRSTFQRLVSSSRKKIATALVKGRAIQIHKIIDFNFSRLGLGFGKGRRGRGNGQRRGFGRRKF